MAGKVVSVTSYDVATGRATIDVFGQPLTDVLNVTGERLQPGWVVWAEQRGEALHADWVVTGIYSPVVRPRFYQIGDAASGTRTLTSYGDLTGPSAGPAVTVPMAQGESVLIVIQARVIASAATVGPRMSFAVSGTETVAASDASMWESDSTSGITQTGSFVFTATGAAGDRTFTAKYRIVNAGTGTWLERWITAIRG